jgi:hypothetical protein
LHTHWDREWYLPFNHYRAFLLERFRQTFAALESGEVGVNFYFDGQAIVFDDLIEIDASFAPRIKNLMKKDLLSAGPWYVLPDQSLVGGESLIRNLKVGIEIVKRFGEPTLTGYNPDTFCHVQDLPRILKGCGIDTAMVLRGVPEIGDNNSFWWESPDGSTVLTYWFKKGLTHTTFHYTDDVKVMAEDLSSWWPSPDGSDKLMLFSAGKDHTQAPGQFKRKIEELNKILPEGRKALAISIDEFLVDLKNWAKERKLPELSGDLRDNTNTAVSEWFPAYVLDGVSSTRLYLKRANALTEHRLIRIDEPLFAMLQVMGVMSYPKHELDYLWRLLLQNHPHDSICGCSVDPVHQEMMTRTQQINSFLDGLDDIALNHLDKWDGKLKALQTLTLPTTGRSQANDPASGNDRLLIFNTSCYAAAAPIKMTWYLEADRQEQELAENKLDENVQIDSIELEPHYLFYTGDNIYYKPIKRVKGWVYPHEVPALGYSEQQWDPANGCIVSDSRLVRNSAENRTSSKISDENSSGDWQISNGLIQAKLDIEGNLVVISQQNSDTPSQVVLGHHVYDVGDGGDSYNFDPLSGDTPLKAKFTGIKPGMTGPLVSSFILSYSLDIPEGLDSQNNAPELYDKRQRSKKLIKHTINTEVSIRKDVPILFFKTTWENHSKEHRLEVRFKTEQPVTESIAECHFSTAKHLPVVSKMKLPVEVGKEAPPSGYFCQRFFIAAEQIFFNCGMPEYRMENDHVAMTLLRAVSYLSRGRLRTRGGGAGPWEPTPEANCLGENCCEYGFAFLEKTNDTEANDQQITRAYQLTDLFEGRLIPFYSGKFKEYTTQSLIEISNPALYVTALYVEQDSIMLRILNTSSGQQQANVSVVFPVSKVSKVNLLGEDPQGDLSAKKETSGKTTFELTLQKSELVTLKLHS